RFLSYVLGQSLRQIHRSRVMVGGLGIRVKPGRVVSGMDQKLNRPGKVAAAFKMECKLSGDLGCAPSVVTCQLLASLFVQHDFSFRYQAAVEKILVERMRETVARRKRPVW